jgi:hypothetical protein
MSEQTATADPQQSTSIFDEPEIEETETTAGEEPGASAVEEVETTEGEPTEALQTEEEDADYLPSEQSKVFPVEELARYGKRYGYTKEEIDADPRLQRFLKDKINSDILIQQQKTLEAQVEEEPTLEEEPEQAPVDPSEARKQWFESVEKFVDQNRDPENAKQFLAALTGATDPKTGVTDPIKLTRAFEVFGTNLINTGGQAMVKGWVENAFPGFGQMYAQLADQQNRPMYNAQWDKVKASNELFKDLPAFGTPEFKEWSWTTAQKIPNFESMFSNLPLEQAAYSKYALLAMIGSGQKVTPAIVKQAAETGKRQAAESQRKKLAGNLGAGQSKGQIAARKTGNSDIFGDVGEVAISQRL